MPEVFPAKILAKSLAFQKASWEVTYWQKYTWSLESCPIKALNLGLTLPPPTPALAINPHTTFSLC